MIRKLSLSLLTCCSLSLIGCKQVAPSENNTQTEILCETDSIEVICKTITPAKDEYDVDQVSLYLRNKFTDKEDLLLTTVPPTTYFWYIGDGDKFYTASIDSIPAVQNVFVYNQRPLQLIVEGCPDCRNIFSFFIDVESKETWYIPANSGYMGGTEEGYMVFQSYRYVSDPEIAGRYTFLQVFDETGIMVDSLDLEHVILDKSYGTAERQ